ncbi:efflux RND transporter periplasmic adaptor subunit [Haloferula sp.]|uniref:efflux RND transporter periplasmic adaptor subunit n=1 Tax=Haloferula sp. TaxID=2497595 RepID=UPI003C74BF0C
MKLLLLLAVLALVSCGKKQSAPAPQPLPVTVAKPVSREVIVYKNFPATLVGSVEIEIRARVSGILEKADFKGGYLVEKGQELFVIQPEPYQLAVNAAEADLERASAGEQLAEKKRNRIAAAAKTRAVSEIDLEIANAELAQAKAAVSQAEAKLSDAKISLGYTSIAAPVTGRMSRVLVDPGNLVGGVNPTLLATIIDDSVMRAYFEVPERAMIKYLDERSKEGGVERFADKKIRLELADGTIYDKPGTIDFIDNRIDPSTRTAKVRAIFPNPDAHLSSGLYGLVGFPAGPNPDNQDQTTALLIPSVAILRDLAGDYVWIVDDSNTVRRRSIVAGDSVEAPVSDPNRVPERQTVILKGLDGSERVIVSGLQRARDGAVVAPQPAP